MRKRSKDHQKTKGGLRTFRTLASFRLHMLARLSERFYEQFYRRRFGLSLIECRLIGITGGFGLVSFKRACEEAHLDKSHASRLLNRLIRRGLLQRANHPSDQRSVLLALTSAGRACHRALHACATRLGEEWLSVLDARSRKAFQDALVKLTDQICAMSEAEARRKSRTRRTLPRKVPARAEPPPLVVDRRMARELYELLGSALNGSERPGGARTSRSRA